MIIVLIILFAALAFPGITWIYYQITFLSPNKTQGDDFRISTSEQMAPFRERALSDIVKIREKPFEAAEILSGDGLRLKGRYYHQKDGAPLVIAFHGYRGTAFRDFSAGSHGYLSFGFNLLMIDERAHGGSEGHTITFGIRERYDCLDCARYAAERFGSGTKIILAGISMGAATVLMASELDLPGNVCGIIADCPYSTPEAIIKKVLKGRGLPVPMGWFFVRAAALLFGHFDIAPAGQPGGASPEAGASHDWNLRADAREAVTRAKVPILLIHGEDDHFVPCDMSREIAAANPEKIRFHTFPGAGHGLSYLVDEPRYTGLIRDFTSEIL